MAIEFNCPKCQARIRTPDETAGKAAKCPKCSGIVNIPGAGPAAGNPLGAGQYNPLGAGPQNPLGVRPTAAPNPFGDSSSGFGPPPLNPYASPAPAASMGSYYGRNYRDAARQMLLVPAICLIVFAGLGLVFMAFAAIGFFAAPDGIPPPGDQPGEAAGYYGFIIGYFTVGLLSRLVQLAGAIAMLRVRGYSLAMAGAIAAIVPCDVYCCLFCAPLGIWSLIMLNKPEVKAGFQSP